MRDMERFGGPEHNRDKLYVLLPSSLSRKEMVNLHVRETRS